jgi:hypothetical protein
MSTEEREGAVETERLTDRIMELVEARDRIGDTREVLRNAVWHTIRAALGVSARGNERDRIAYEAGWMAHEEASDTLGIGGSEMECSARFRRQRIEALADKIESWAKSAGGGLIDGYECAGEIRKLLAPDERRVEK